MEPPIAGEQSTQSVVAGLSGVLGKDQFDTSLLKRFFSIRSTSNDSDKKMGVSKNRPVMQQLLVTRITKIGLLQQLRCTGCQGLGDGKPHMQSDWIPKADSNCLKCLHVSRKNME